MDEVYQTLFPESMDSEAADLLLDYLKRTDLQLTGDEWSEVLNETCISESSALTARAEEMGLLLPVGILPDRETFVLPPSLCIYLTARNMHLKMTSREWDVLHYRNGFADGIFHTLAETGEKFGVTRERIRQVEEKAFRRGLGPRRRNRRKNEFF